MTTKWAMVASLVLVFLAGALATLNPPMSIAAIAVSILAIIVGTRFRPASLQTPSVGMQPDWIIVLLPTVLTVRAFSNRAAVLAIGLLVVAAFMRKADGRFRIEPGPALLLFAAAAIVFCRPDHFGQLTTVFLLLALVVRLVTTVDARKIIGSLIDGCGLYLLANILCNIAGLKSPASDSRIGGLIETTGFVRTLYPLTTSLNTPPVIASLYAVAVIFLLLEAGWLRRSLRVICLIAAIVVLVSTGSRLPLSVTAVISIAVICYPSITRWMAQAATIVAAASAVVLPGAIASLQSAITLLMSLTPGRGSTARSITSIEGRDYIWARSIRYWTERINDGSHMMFGFGSNGHYRSGASLGYSDQFKAILRVPETASLHNSFLQQLFDGGILGCALLIAAAYWTSTRLAKRRNQWGPQGSSAVAAMTVLLLSAMTEVSLAPGATHETFWLLVVLVGVACQARGSQADTTSTLTDTRHDTTATQHTGADMPGSTLRA